MTTTTRTRGQRMIGTGLSAKPLSHWPGVSHAIWRFELGANDGGGLRVRFTNAA